MYERKAIRCLTKSLASWSWSAMKLRFTSLFALLLFFVTPSTCTLTFEVEENIGAGELLGRLNFTFAQVMPSFQGPCVDRLTIVGDQLRTAVQLDREEVVSETGGDTLFCNLLVDDLGYVQIQVNVLDVNDNTPRFSELGPVHMLNITENFNIPNPILRLQTVDGDKGENGTVVFNITTGNEEDFFYIGLPLDYEGDELNRQELFFNRTVDYETYQNFNLTITIHDHGTPPRYFQQNIYIRIIDVNDEGPLFVITNYYFDVPESHPLGVPFGNVSALDRDSVSSTIVYSASGDPSPDEAFDYVGLNNQTGELYLKLSIDFEIDTTLQRIEFSIHVREEDRLEVDVARVHINILNVNEDAPEISVFRNPGSVLENTPTDPFFTFRVTDPEGDGIGNFEIQFQPFVKNSNRTASIYFTIIIEEVLDREKMENITLTFTVYDKGIPPLHTTKTVHLIILDENDNDPSFTEDAYHAVVGENTPLLKRVTKVEASDPDFAENGSVSYAITSVSPTIAQQWFDIDPLTGYIVVNASLNYSTADSVSLVVTASDHGPAQDNSSIHRSASTTVNISISPAVTFKPRSYQEHCNLDFKLQDTSKIYLEFRTSEKNGLLLYEETAENELFVLEIQSGNLIATPQYSSRSIFEGFDVSTNEWISVLYDSEQKTLDAWYTEGEGEESERTNILGESKVVRCDTSTQSTDQTFFVGGIDIFSQLRNSSEISDFVGVIRNLVVDSVQVDLATPIREENTARGVLLPSETKCGESDMLCRGPHYTGCFDYDMESHCICAGGFSAETCKEEKNYAPIQLASASIVELELDDYSLFYDLELRSGLVNADTSSRKRRSSADTAGYQLVEFQFRLLRNSTGTLLYSRTESSIHTLEIHKPSSEYSLRYLISDTEFTSTEVFLTEILNYEIGKVYTVVINITTTDVTVSFNGTKKEFVWSNTVTPFIQYPQTLVSLGGTNNPKVGTTSDFTGCITRLAVNGIEFPLNGLLENNDPSVKISQGGASSVSTTCDLCQQERPPCPGTTQCVTRDDHYECECPAGLMLEEDQCVEPPTPPTMSPTPVVEPLNAAQTTPIPLYYIIAGVVGVVAITIVALLLVVSALYCRLLQRRNKKQKYHVGGDTQLPQLGNGERSRPNSYMNVTRRPSLCNSEPGFITVPRHHHESSMSTEHDIDEDIESGSNTQNMTRSKSSTSGETGFHTASERDERSIPRMDDSGNEKETEYSPFDSESDDESQSYMGTHSPAGIHHGHHKGRGLTLAPFSTPSESSGPISSLGAPLTPKEKKFITPLRPDSRSELDEETDLDTDFSSTVVTKSSEFTRSYRGSLKLNGRPGSGNSGYQWYKSSTSSDTERERKRAEGNHAYYPPSQYRSLRLPRAKSVSPSQHNGGVPHLIPLTRKSLSPISPPHMQLSRPKRVTHSKSPPIPPPTSYNHHTLPSRAHPKERITSKASDDSEFSTPVLSRSQPLKMHHPFFRQSSSDSPRIPPHLAPRSYMPSYIRSYSGDSTTRKGEKKFVDLGSVRTNCDPIQYWEGQRRMRATVDQVDGYPVLSESFTPFEDSASEGLSMNESQQSGPEHQSFSSQGGGEATAEALDIGLLQLRDCDTDSVATETTLKGSETESKIIHFPSADCSEEYRHTPQMLSTVGTSSGSDLIHHSCSLPPSQGTFEV